MTPVDLLLGLTLFAGVALFIYANYKHEMKSKQKNITDYCPYECDSVIEARYWVVISKRPAGFDSEKRCWYVQLKKRRLEITQDVISRLVLNREIYIHPTDYSISPIKT